MFQARQKLTSVSQANSGKISSEELIKYAHKISASNAVAAPPGWTIGNDQFLMDFFAEMLALII